MKAPSKKRIGVLRGGPSSEHSFSLESGQNVLDNLDRSKFIAVDLYIDKAGVWYSDGVISNPHAALQFIDIVFNALHGEYGEDGAVQAILEDLNVPYTGSTSFTASFAIDKHATKQLLAVKPPKNLKMPRSKKILASDSDVETTLVEVWQKFHHPLIVKPTSTGSSVGVSLARDFAALAQSTKAILAKGQAVMIEEYVRGREVSVSVIEGLRSQDHYTPVALEVVYDTEFFDNKTKKSGQYQLRPMRHFSQEQLEAVASFAELVHRQLGVRHYSCSDFIVTSSDIYFLEVNTLPGLTKKSILPTTLQESGIPLKDFLTHVLERVPA